MRFPSVVLLKLGLAPEADETIFPTVHLPNDPHLSTTNLDLVDFVDSHFTDDLSLVACPLGHATEPMGTPSIGEIVVCEIGCRRMARCRLRMDKYDFAISKASEMEVGKMANTMREERAHKNYNIKL
ncbi:26912_t:CDS:2 [Gigaspora margarita]|uniref:26912_t:CDS:1 n=1 Tax=Gigaspora margarita TaxID=4874 RepID=A0ABN7VCP9_GIGMA|nr:26912_t:CDS:2 [Gigaspora margarita]